MAALSFRNIQKVYDNNVQAVFDFNLEVKDKEFIVFVGPSGCGKSTTLRMIAGLEEITAGELYIDDVLVNEVEPKDRGIAMVFQSYALYPHMTVYDNMAFALQLSKVSKEEIDKRVQNAAEILGLKPYLYRKPKALSGGQRQRVALGRAIVRSPKVFLMDEPLSNLDAKLRVQMRSEIASIHKRVGATTIYVTHDQTEAMTMADRIVVMKDGYIQQIGTPREVYNTPSNMFVAGFIGSPSMNFINCQFKDNQLFVDGTDKVISVSEEQIKKISEYGKNQIEVTKNLLTDYETAFKEIDGEMAEAETKKKKKEVNSLTEEKADLTSKYEGLKEDLKGYENSSFAVTIGIRPEDIYAEGDKNMDHPCQLIEMTADIVELLGHELVVYGNLNGQKMVVTTSATYNIESGSTAKFALDMQRAHFFDTRTTKRI